MTVIRYEVYARIIDNEPSFRQDISIELVPGNHILRLAKGKVAFQTEYTIELEDPQELKRVLSGFEAHSVLKDVALAINLLLRRVVLGRRLLHPYSEPQVVQDESTAKYMSSYENVEVLQATESTGSSVSSRTIAMRNSVSITDIVSMSFKSHSIKLEEERVLETLELVHRLAKRDLLSITATELHNLAESLKDFEKAMDHPELSEIFKSLFIAFEKAVNYQKAAQGEKFDNVAAASTNASSDDVKRLRQAYDRFKHPDKTPEQVQKTLEYTKQLPGLIRTLRPLVGRAILSRLKFVIGNP